ncbi:MAG TPA: HEPN domain-containing protein [Candidatus Hydrogenedentes bacterium]|nr:HEPN domain-containing protein [Candidatus Hydrogenedentota bacterium]HNT87343.1 HEPN domain-containing protein [Candidatus Hydrogenedentota bacterium]
MTPITLAWIQKAEADYWTVERESHARKNPNYDGACFHAQQCAEKYLKAMLHEMGVTLPKTHDLAALLDLVLAKLPI